MKRLHWIILRRLPGPFLGWLGTLMFLLVMQFLIRWLPEIAGKGIPMTVILELIVYNLAYMVVLAVPMSVLLAALMTFGGLAESQYYAVIKSTGISFAQLVWPTLVVGLLVTGGMMYFNNVMLPEANHRASVLWKDIRTKRPGFDLQPGVFYNGVDDYSILIGDRPEGTNKLYNITIYDYTEGRSEQAVIKAAHGRLQPSRDGTSITLLLYDGEMHRPRPGTGGRTSKYERLSFARHSLRLDLSDFVFQRSDDGSRRSDRTMPTATMIDVVDSLKVERDSQLVDLQSNLVGYVHLDSESPRNDLPQLVHPDSTSGGSALDTIPVPTPYAGLHGLAVSQQHAVAGKALQEARSAQSVARSAARTLGWKTKRIQRYRVEIYKKFSIAIACLIFMFIGAPLGLSIRRGGLATIGGIALGIFMFYWVTLVQGEKLADRGLLEPWVGMWIANAIMIVVGLWLVMYVILDLRATPPLRSRLWMWLKSLVGRS
ncbi:permease [Longibacter salinarum]|uniref:Permease n=1 Tax=Longibacter salinarum TaxID=1850348 RepID=A0A2A8D0B2_9BACT|nr:LptF/LptG family permease [Longibacter salinarum]PEN14375.1 permease [Longibacter salinarum]